VKFRTAVILTLAIAVGAAAWVLSEDRPLRLEGCTARASTYESTVDLEQAQWASLMAAEAQRRGMPVRATTIAIAAAFQESKIHNIEYGDRDSIGLFQQRPSQGWGTREQILDPRYAIGRFYSALEKVHGYGDMAITEAAQRVQHSAFPAAYAAHEPAARALASTLRGYSAAKFSCTLRDRDAGDPRAVRKDVVGLFDTTGRLRHGAVEFSRPGDAAAGWGLAHYLVAQAARLHITGVSYAGHRWTVKDSPDGWVKARAGGDHIRVTTR
jgi:hypothetical protein